MQRRKVAQVEASTCPPHQRESAVRGAHSAHDLFPCPTTLLCSHSCALFGPLAMAYPQLAHVEPATKWESQCTTQVRISWCSFSMLPPALPPGLYDLSLHLAGACHVGSLWGHNQDRCLHWSRGRSWPCATSQCTSCSHLGERQGHHRFTDTAHNCADTVRTRACGFLMRIPHVFHAMNPWVRSLQAATASIHPPPPNGIPHT